MYMSIEWRSLRKFDRSVCPQLNSKVGKKCMGSYGSSKKLALELCGSPIFKLFDEVFTYIRGRKPGKVFYVATFFFKINIKDYFCCLG